MKLQAGKALQHWEVKVLSQEEKTHSGAGCALSPQRHRKKEDEATLQSPFFLPFS